jgi:hypothetical protein
VRNTAAPSARWLVDVVGLPVGAADMSTASGSRPATSARKRPGRLPGRSTADMIAECFRHQHPEAFGRPEVKEPHVPDRVRYGRDYAQVSRELVPEEPVGYPDAVPLPPSAEGDPHRA